MNRWLLFLVAWLICSQVQSQDYVEIAQAGYRYSFKTQGNEGNEGRSVQGWRLNAMITLKITDQSYLLPGFRYWQ